MLKQREYLVIFVILITEVLGFSLILPFLPYYATDLGANPLEIGLILTTFSLFQFITAPILGRLSDIFGRKPILIISQLSTLISFIILGFATNLKLIFLSRAIDGLFGSNFTVAQAYLSDISSKENRSKAFGISGAAFGFGFLIGPALGGFLSKYGYRVPAFTAAGVTTITIILTGFLLKETVNNKKITFSEIRKVKIIDLQSFSNFFKNNILSKKLLAYYTFILSHVLFVSSYALYGKIQLDLTVTVTGYVLAYVGLNSIIIRGFLLNKLIDKFGERNLTYAGFYSMLFSLLILFYAPSIVYLLIATTFFSFGSGCLRPLLLGEVSRSVEGNEQGKLLGVTDALGSTAQIIGPLVAGFILNYMYSGFLPLISFIVLLPGFVVYFKLNKSNA